MHLINWKPRLWLRCMNEWTNEWKGLVWGTSTRSFDLTIKFMLVLKSVYMRERNEMMMMTVNLYENEATILILHGFSLLLFSLLSSSFFIIFIVGIIIIALLIHQLKMNFRWCEMESEREREVKIVITPATTT